LTILEHQLMVVTMVSDLLNRGLSVAIGSETGLPLADCSVVLAPLFVDGEQAGSVGVLGPTRMDYPRALAAVRDVSDRLGASIDANALDL
jgi:heat-inducible transcriptional repressor